MLTSSPSAGLRAWYPSLTCLLPGRLLLPPSLLLRLPALLGRLLPAGFTLPLLLVPARPGPCHMADLADARRMSSLQPRGLATLPVLLEFLLPAADWLSMSQKPVEQSQDINLRISGVLVPLLSCWAACYSTMAF